MEHLAFRKDKEISLISNRNNSLTSYDSDELRPDITEYIINVKRLVERGTTHVSSEVYTFLESTRIFNTLVFKYKAMINCLISNGNSLKQHDLKT